MDPREELRQILKEIYADKPEQIELIVRLAGDAWKDVGAETAAHDPMEKTVAGDALCVLHSHGPRSPYLLVQIKGLTLDTIDLAPGLYCIGRHPVNHIQLWAQDQSVSRIHCMLAVSPDNRIAIHDLASTNGTFVNGKSVTEEGREVQFEDQIRVGEHHVLTLS